MFPVFIVRKQLGLSSTKSPFKLDPTPSHMHLLGHVTTVHSSGCPEDITNTILSTLVYAIVESCLLKAPVVSCQAIPLFDYISTVRMLNFL